MARPSENIRINICEYIEQYLLDVLLIYVFHRDFGLALPEILSTAVANMEKDEVPADLTAPVSRGCVYWITGLSGAGKTTLAQSLAARLISIGRSVVQLDGDRIRAVLDGRFGHGQHDRHALALIYARLSRELADQGHDVVCATVSMFNDVRAWSRANNTHYCEIWLRITIEQLVDRHPRGLYARGRTGHIRNIPGIDIPLEEPEAPDLILDATLPPDGVVATLFDYLEATKKAA